jgi:PKD repeat protein
LHVDFTPLDSANYTTSSKDVFINVLEQPAIPIANFSSNITSGFAPLSVQFTDLSENSTSWNWDFGDGNSSQEQNPMHTYSAVGNYTVTLTVNNLAGSDAVTKNDYIITSKPEEAIVWGVVPLSLQFTDQSENGISWKWNFGDGTNSTEQNPKHTYTKAGQYAVTVTVNNAAGSNTATYTGYINVVNSLEPPIAAFSALPTYGKVPLNVSFIDNSTGSPTSWKWNFGDGNTSTEQNPTHLYSKSGQYAVTLTVNNVAGSNAITKLSHISVGNSLKAPVTAFSVSVAP